MTENALQVPAGTLPLLGRTALVSGSGRNIGRAIALRLAQAGADVIVNGHRDADAIHAVADEIRALGRKADAVLADVSNAEQCTALVTGIIENFGALDILVSNVGVRPYQPLASMSIEDWDHAVRMNLSGAFYLLRPAIPSMVARGFGRFIAISGYAAFTGQSANRAHVLAAKMGLHGLVRGVARELGSQGVTANAVVPGAIQTERDKANYPTLDVDAVTARIPVGRWGLPEDIGEACAFLASPAGAFVNGHSLHVNGGEYMA